MTMTSFRRASKRLFQHLLQMVKRKVRQLRRDWWACLDSSLDKKAGTEPPLCEPSTSLHHAVNWRLYWEGLTTQVYREHMSPLTLESSTSAPAATLQSVLVGGLFRRVCSDMQTGGWTWYRSAACSSARVAVVVAKPEV